MGQYKGFLKILDDGRGKRIWKLLLEEDAANGFQRTTDVYVPLEYINEKYEKEPLVEQQRKMRARGNARNTKTQEISCTLHEKHMLETMFISAYENSNEVKLARFIIWSHLPVMCSIIFMILK